MQAAAFGTAANVAGTGLQTAAFSGIKDAIFGPKPGWAVTLIYALVFGIAVTLILITVDHFVPFLPFNPSGKGPSALARSGKKFWSSVETDTENLVVSTADSPTKLAANWSASVQLIIADSRNPNPMSGTFRHILHRGSNPVGISTSTSGSTGQAGIQPTDLPSDTEPSYKQMGLPQIMNPGVFLDKYKNDIHIFMHTRGLEKGEHALWLESMTIEDLPLNTPITLGLVCNGKQLDVYVNCRLYSSMLLKGTPYLPKADNQWFGRYGTAPFTGLVKNLTLWSSQLGSSDYIGVCRQGSFKGTELPTTCATKSSSPVETALHSLAETAAGGEEVTADTVVTDLLPIFSGGNKQ
jgi:hypothetical protein